MKFPALALRPQTGLSPSPTNLPLGVGHDAISPTHFKHPANPRVLSISGRKDTMELQCQIS